MSFLFFAVIVTMAVIMAAFIVAVHFIEMLLFLKVVTLTGNGSKGNQGKNGKNGFHARAVYVSDADLAMLENRKIYHNS